MARVVSIGTQDFESLISNGYFYIDKTDFIKEWWESCDAVTLITRPQCFGKTLNMNMLARFFSVKYENQGEIFEGLNIWKEEKYQELQGTYPVIFLSFAGVKADNYEKTREQIFRIIGDLYLSTVSMFSDLNMNIATIMSNKYAPYFGFTEEEVFAAMDEFGLTNKEEVKEWYDGFTIGDIQDIYNPWSITNFQSKERVRTGGDSTGSAPAD